ncbi:MAG: DUF6520 family protein [Sediminicola sp.]
MKTKFLLPVLAIIFAVGMSFTSAKMDVDPDNDYIFRNNQWQAIPEINCNPEDQACLVLVTPEEEEYEVYDSPNSNDPKEGDGTVAAVINLP